MVVTGENRNARNVPVLLDWNRILHRERSAWAALRSGSSNSGTIIIVRDTAPRKPRLIYSDQQECFHQE